MKETRLDSAVQPDGNADPATAPRMKRSLARGTCLQEHIEG